MNPAEIAYAERLISLIRAPLVTPLDVARASWANEQADRIAAGRLVRRMPRALMTREEKNADNLEHYMRRSRARAARRAAAGVAP